MEAIKYTLVQDDVKDYTRYLYKIPRIKKFMMKSHIRAYIVLFISMFVCFWAFIDGGRINWGDLSLPVALILLKYFLVAFVIYLVICIMLWFISTRDLFGASSRTSFRFLEGQSLDTELKIVEEGLLASNETSSGLIKWDGIVDIYKSNKSIFIFKGDYIALIVPKRAFENEDRFNYFYDFIKDKISKNKEN